MAVTKVQAGLALVVAGMGLAVGWGRREQPMQPLAEQRPPVVTAKADGKPQPRVDALGAALWRTDPLAEAVVLAFSEMAPGKGKRFLERALEEGIEKVPAAPRALVAELRMLRHVAVRHPSAFLQHAYAVYLSMGHHESHARRVNQALRDRVAAAAQALGRFLPQFGFRVPQGGASIWVQGPDWLDASELASRARRRGVLIEPGDVFFLAPPYPCPYFRLRLSSIVPDRIAPGTELAVEGFLAPSRKGSRTLLLHITGFAATDDD